MYLCKVPKVQKSFFMPQLSLHDIRKDYRMASLSESDVLSDPFRQFEKWFAEVLHAEVEEANAMTLATVAEDGSPSARIVLLKDFDERGFYFYTNYGSRKARQLDDNPHAAVVFFWKELERQVRIEGIVRRAEPQMSDAYYAARPRESQIGAWASPQSEVIPGRSFLEERVAEIRTRFQEGEVKRPGFWGGFVVAPKRVEFWQGRASRLHDRIQYRLQPDESWVIERLAP